MTISVNQLEGLALVVANKYKVYCNKTQEARRRKSQLQLLSKQKQRSDLRQLERTLIPASPAASASFTADLEGPLKQQSSRTGLWWSVHARLDIKRKCLLFTAKSTDPSSAAQQAVALSRYVLCHELPEHHARRAAAFELVPQTPELPIVTLCADGSMLSRKWVCELQRSIDLIDEDDYDGEGGGEGGGKGGECGGEGDVPASPAPTAAAAEGITTPPMPQPPAPPTESPGVPSALKPLAKGLEQMGELTSAKLDELDKRLSGTLAEQSQRTEVQLSALSDERRAAADGFTSALDDFNAAMASQMGVELLRISQAELEYHQGMVAHLQQLVGSLQAQRPRDAAGLPADYLRKPPSPTFAPPERAPFEATSASDLSPAPPSPSVSRRCRRPSRRRQPPPQQPAAATIEASLAPVEVAEEAAPAAPPPPPPTAPPAAAPAPPPRRRRQCSSLRTARARAPASSCRGRARRSPRRRMTARSSRPRSGRAEGRSRRRRPRRLAMWASSWPTRTRSLTDWPRRRPRAAARVSVGIVSERW